MSSSISKRLADNLGTCVKDSYYNAFLVLPENCISNLFADKFNIKDAIDLDKFHQAFRVCTEGQGNELKSINNVVSSALLPLLTFFRLFGKNSGFSLKLEHKDCGTIEFDQCFFEVRNDVLNKPSCVDVALYSSEQDVMMFLESKLSEYLRTSGNFEIKEGYRSLYSTKSFKHILSFGDVTFDGSKIKYKNGEKAYLEGIKQSISHLIGLVQGPSQKRSGVYYPEQYLKDYQECYNNAKMIYYSTIIFDPKTIGVSKEEAEKYDRYVYLYTEIIGKHGEEILENIRNWSKLKEDQGKNIKVLSEPLFYQSVFANNSDLLLDDVRSFYKLKNDKLNAVSKFETPTS